MRNIIILSAVLSLAGCASVQDTAEKMKVSLNKAVEGVKKPATQTQEVRPEPRPLIAQEPVNVMYGKILGVKKKKGDSNVTLVIQLSNGATFSLPPGPDTGFKVGQTVKISQRGKEVSVEAQ